MTDFEWNREAMTATLIEHQRMEIGGNCSCGWGSPGQSFAGHIIADYEDRLKMIYHLLGKPVGMPAGWVRRQS